MRDGMNFLTDHLILAIAGEREQFNCWGYPSYCIVTRDITMVSVTYGNKNCTTIAKKKCLNTRDNNKTKKNKHFLKQITFIITWRARKKQITVPSVRTIYSYNNTSSSPFYMFRYVLPFRSTTNWPQDENNILAMPECQRN